jgi:ribosomal protein S18 acetylase RimI-like enzyme
MRVRLRSARSEEAATIVDLWRAAGAAPGTTDDAGSVRRLLDTSPDALVVADDGGRLVGTVIAGWDGWRGAIYRLAVLPDHRRRGLGRAMVAEAVRRLRGAGAARLAAIVIDDDDQAMAFWTAIGWHRQESRARFVRDL